MCLSSSARSCSRLFHSPVLLLGNCQSLSNALEQTYKTIYMVIASSVADTLYQRADKPGKDFWLPSLHVSGLASKGRLIDADMGGSACEQRLFRSLLYVWRGVC